jgi:hypothetical protein
MEAGSSDISISPSKPTFTAQCDNKKQENLTPDINPVFVRRVSATSTTSSDERWSHQPQYYDTQVDAVMATPPRPKDLLYRTSGPSIVH